MLEIKNLTLYTRHPILDSFSYAFEPGKLYGLVAANGTGKTTFFRAIMGLIKLKNGTVTIDGEDGEKKRRQLFYFESSEWFDTNLTGKDYLIFIKKKWKSSQNLQEVIDYWGMEDYVTVPIRKYSLGMKQRLLIAMYQVSQAPYLLMDEITNGLDEKSREALFLALKKMTLNGTMIILSSHYKEDILSICDAMITLENQEMKVKE
ncbi:MAG: ABC transporter ATP-binding protein [Streptococcaceae bacterium]|jgi:ABC-2 type transport system ATP-binding protein|nr:ABC transporter ATP-binding protein [Streptococcaceae bacterium]